MAEREDLDHLIRGNPAYRDIDLDGGSAGGDAHPRYRPRSRRLADIPRHPDRPLAWRLLGLPTPRELVRALIIDGYPTSTHRWAFGRVSFAVGWACVASGIFIAAFASWVIRTLGGDPDAILIVIMILGLLASAAAVTCLLPIFAAIRYAARWRHEMSRPTRR